MTRALFVAHTRRWGLLLLSALLSSGCYGFRPIAHEEIADAGLVRLTSPVGVALHQLGVTPPPGAPTCRAHHVSGNVSRVSADSITIVRITEITPVAGSAALCRDIASASVVNGGPEQLMFERARLRPVATLGAGIVGLIVATVGIAALLWAGA